MLGVSETAVIGTSAKASLAPPSSTPVFPVLHSNEYKIANPRPGRRGLTFPLDTFWALTPVGLAGVGGLGLIGYGIYSLFPNGSHRGTPPCQ